MPHKLVIEQAKVTKKDIHNLMIKNPIIYACVRNGSDWGLSWEEIMMLCVRELDKAYRRQQQLLEAALSNQLNPIIQVENGQTPHLKTGN